MSGWKVKRFWKDALVREDGEQLHVLLDARPVKTPSKALLALPTRALSEAVAAEWRQVEGMVDPRAMPVTRSANAAIDKVATQFHEVAGLIAEYGGSDLLCYRAEAPPELAAAQAAAWNPMLDWARRRFGAELVVTAGVAHVAQPAACLAALSAPVQAGTPFQ